FVKEKIVYSDDDHIAFLSGYPTLEGYTVVCPRRHVTDVLELSTADYLATQAVVHRIARAISTVVDTERMYIMSLGSMQGNDHIHWHLAPLPPGVAYERQQYHALMSEFAGVLDIPDADREKLAADIARAVADDAGGQRRGR